MSGLDRVPCARCGVEHDLSNVEPSYRRPDLWFTVPEHERSMRIRDGNDACGIRALDDSERRYFLRVRLPMPVRGESRACCWGLWVEVSEQALQRVRELWDDPRQAEEPAFEGRIANALAGYESTLGLPGQVTLTDPSSIPFFHLAPELDHPLAWEQREGVWPERVLEWVSAHIHD